MNENIKNKLAYFNEPEITEYQQEALDFLKKTNTTIDIKYKKFDKYFSEDTQKRDVYEITIKRNNRKFSFNFGQSFYCSGIVHGWSVKNSTPFRYNGVNCIACGDIENLNFYETKDFKLLEKRQYPNEYSILACLTKYPIDTFKDFCAEFGYDHDSKKAERIYNSVKEEWSNVQKIWSDDEIELLQKIN